MSYMVIGVSASMQAQLSSQQHPAGAALLTSELSMGPSLPLHVQAMLEMQLRHLVVAQELQVECRGGAGEPFRIERLLRPQPADQPSEPTSMTI